MYKNKLESKMRLYGDTQETLAKALGISIQRLNAKINCCKGADFRQREIKAIKERYNLTSQEIDEIFFNLKVSFNDT